VSTQQMDLLDLLSHDPRREDEYRQFLDACKQVRLGQREYVSINDVRSRLSNQWGLVIEPRRYSSFFSRARREGALLRTNVLDVNSDERSRNKGKPCWLYRWTGGAS
jgi:hypothetical protein